jgi:hypothetical protein
MLCISFIEEIEYIFMCDMMQIYISYLTVLVLHELQDITYCK